MKYLRIMIVILLTISVFSGCSKEEKNSPSDTSSPTDVVEVTPTLSLDPNDPFVFLDALESLDEIRVEYVDGAEVTISDKELLSRFTEALRSADPIESFDEAPVIEKHYTIYFDDHTLERGFDYEKIDDHLIERSDPNDPQGYGHEELRPLLEVLEEIGYVSEESINRFDPDKITKVDGLDDLFSEETFTNFDRGTIDASFVYGAPGFDDSIVPIYDFNEGSFLYNFYNTKTMEKGCC